MGSRPGMANANCGDAAEVIHDRDSNRQAGGRGLSSAQCTFRTLGGASRRGGSRALRSVTGGGRTTTRLAVFGGVMLMAGPETEAPEIAYPLEVEGWRAVSIGFYSTNPGPQAGSATSWSGCRATTPSRCSIRCGADAFEQQGQLEEIYWKTADLTGQQIVFGSSRAEGAGRGAGRGGVRPGADRLRQAGAADRG